MKKNLLVFSTLALLMSVAVGTKNSAVVNASEAKDDSYYIESSTGLVDFENGLSAIAVQWGEMKLETSNPISGNASISAKSTDAGYPMDNFRVNTGSSYKGAGTYFVEFDVKPAKNVAGALVAVNTTGGTSASDHMTEFSIQFTYDGEGNVVDAVMLNIGGFLGAGSENYQNGRVEAKENGVYHCYFEYEMTETVASSLNASPLLAFKNKALNAADNQLLWDNIDFGLVGAVEEVAPSKYYTYDENNDFEDLSQTSLPFNYTSFWGYVNGYGDTLLWETENPILGNRSVKFEYTAGELDNFQIGGLDISNLVDKKVCVEFDAKMAGFTKVVMWNPGTYWTELAITSTGATSNGNVTGLSSYVKDDGTIHVKYYLENPSNDIRFNAWGKGSAIIDNVKVSYEDYTPYVATSGMDKYFEKVAVIDYDLKGAEFISLKCGDAVVDSSMYTNDSENQTITLPVTSYNESSTTYTIVSSKGESTFTIGLKDVSDKVQNSVAEVESYMNLAYRYTAADNTSEFRLQVGVDASIADIAASYANASWGIEVSTETKTMKFDEVVKEDGTIKYVVIGLGDVLNNTNRAKDVFTARAYIEVDGVTYYSEAVKSYSVAQMIAEYKTQGKPVDGMYQAFVDSGLYA